MSMASEDWEVIEQYSVSQSAYKPVMIEILIKEFFGQFDPFSLNISHVATIQDLLNKCTQKINQILFPNAYRIWQIREESFLNMEVLLDIEIHDQLRIVRSTVRSRTLATYNPNTIKTKGLTVSIINEYEHNIASPSITRCAYVKNGQSPTVCPIYSSLKDATDEKDMSELQLNHLYESSHFGDEFNEKPRCLQGNECKSFRNLENGGNALKDRCHVKIFRHPPRSSRQIKLAQNIHKFIVNTDEMQNHSLYEPTADDKKQFQWNKDDGFLNALINEVIRNGFKSDLCLTDNDCKNDTYSLLDVVDDKMNHPRHKQMGNVLSRDLMLSLVLYCGCECNYDLCASQRNGDYGKWKWFDLCLCHAVEVLSAKETGEFMLYSGLNQVKLDKKEIRNGYFPTFTSTSWIKEQALAFLGQEGMIIQLDAAVRRWFFCCDVSWISKFPDESEILIARSVSYNNFVLNVVDEINGIQTVSLGIKYSEDDLDSIPDLEDFESE
eukprot:391387_1